VYVAVWPEKVQCGMPLASLNKIHGVRAECRTCTSNCDVHAHGHICVVPPSFVCHVL